MIQITLTYYGHSCFRIEAGGHSAVFDPYDRDSVPGISLPAVIKADIVYCSHGHADHNAAHLITVTGDGSDPFRSETVTVPHDDADGALRGMNLIRTVYAGKARIVHMGDIGRMPSKEEYGRLKAADVLMIPCGGHYTIDASQAAEIIAEVQPTLAILMHFRKEGRGYDVIADIEDVKKSFPALTCLNETSIIFEDSDVPKGIIALEPLQD